MVAQAIFALAERGDPTPNGRYMLTEVEGEALDEGGVDVPTTRREHLLDGLQGPEYDAVAHAHQAPTPYGLDHLRLQQPWQRHPAPLGQRALGLTPSRLHPGPLEH